MHLMIVLGRLILIYFIGIQLNVLANDIELQWEVQHPKSMEWISLGKKGSVQEMLINSGELPDPFIGLNEDKFAWIEEYQWHFKSLFFVDKSMLDHDFLELNFANLDTYCDILLNGEKIGESNNYFKPYDFQIKDKVKEGLNEIELVFTPPVMYHKKTWEDQPFHYPAPNDVNEIAIAPLTRKPQYQFGWDWSLRMNTIGLNEIAKLEFYNTGKVFNYTANVVELTDNHSEAKVKYSFDLGEAKLDKVVIQSTLFGTHEVEVKDGVASTKITIEYPRLWWPIGFGDQYLYEDVVYLKTLDNQDFSKLVLNFGVKSSELIQEKDEWGTSYYFKINGERIFAKGANYIPQDVFPSRIKDSDIESMVQIMKESNCNMVRVWGGGYYQNEVFYDACDKAGIMVWQDLMFACAMYPGDSSFLENVKGELEYQIPRIAKHPSVVQFNGNNEVEVAWGNWGFQLKYGIYGQNARTVEQAYDDLFKGVAPNVIKDWTLIPYIHTSPLSNWGKAEFYNHGSQHYWGVWHGKDPIEDFGKKTGRFNAEYGFQSFPEYSTLLYFSDTSQWDIQSEVMKQHQKSYVGNDMILKHAKKLYGEPKNFEEFVYFGQLTQAKAVSIAIAGHRLDAPRCGGTLYWQLNDCWPVSSWSSVDYFGNWKALQYDSKSFYRNIAVLQKFEDLDNYGFYITNDLPTKYEGKVSVELYNFKGKKVEEYDVDVSLNQFEHQEIEIKTPKHRCRKKRNNYVAKFKWLDENNIKQEVQYVINHSEYNKAEKPQYEVRNIDAANQTGELVLKINEFTQDLWISSDQFGVHLESNFESYLPGEYVIPFSYTSEIGYFKMMWR